ncbi:MAG: hypothetical protein KJO07_26010 [Deltaproteobacteria bacterium]|jgi:LEA14-like dessication related protein|nr:hypothetical protein [Deltaproteobacteria bacterium]
MKTYLIRHCRTLALVTAFAALLVGCASQAPKVKVLGVTQPVKPVAEQGIVVFVEVVNPGNHDLQLQRLEYKFKAQKWFESKGNIRLSREVAAGGSAIVELSVPVDSDDLQGAKQGGKFTLEGKLFATDANLERSWKVKARGALRQKSSDRGAYRVQVAARD